MTASIRLSGYQPQYFPRLHYFARILDSDVFTISDYVQYVRKHVYQRDDGSKANTVSHQAHTPIKTRDGDVLLGIPVKRKHRQLLRDTKIDYATPWHRKHLRIIHDNYCRAPYFDSVFPEVTAILEAEHATLSDLTCTTILWGLARMSEMSIDVVQAQAHKIGEVLPADTFRLKQLVFLSEDMVAPPDKTVGRDANDWLIEQCRIFSAQEYYFGGTGARAYMDFERFAQPGITLVEQNWHCQEYPQLHGPFVPNLSILDLLMNVSPKEAREILSTPADSCILRT